MNRIKCNNIGKFIPPRFNKLEGNFNYLNDKTGKKWFYSPSGRASIYKILKNLNVNKILVPIYICKTVLIPFEKLNILPYFYDIDIEDLNPSIDSIKKLVQKYQIKAVLVPSLYGNPANLLEIEKFCKENNIFMIDDSAQSFGAKLNNKYIGTFGRAGFFSFSPGKATFGHMGSFYWSDEQVLPQEKNHCIYHYIK